MQINLYIEKGGSAEEFRRQFNFYYPYLKIEFSTRPFNKQGHASKHASKKDPAEMMNGKSNHLKQFTSAGHVNISGNRTVRELETELARLGLYGQVLRKSGHMWIETVLTNDWTLQHQNYEGEQISSLYEKRVIPPTS